MSSIFGTTLGTVSIAAVGLIVLVAVVYQAFFRGRSSFGSGEHVRLDVIDAAPIDAKRRLVLVRRDDVEHLIVIGGTNDLILETGIKREETARNAPIAKPDVHDQPTVRPQVTPAQTKPIEKSLQKPAPAVAEPQVAAAPRSQREASPRTTPPRPIVAQEERVAASRATRQVASEVRSEPAPAQPQATGAPTPARQDQVELRRSMPPAQPATPPKPAIVKNEPAPTPIVPQQNLPASQSDGLNDLDAEMADLVKELNRSR
ncbi:MAG: hypothetical protein AAGI92_04200 [Pseudomonadota bacterium]